MNEKRKAFVFVNSFLAPVHAGVQSAHAIAELFLHNECDSVFKWARDDKTLIMLSGGDVEKMDAIRAIVKSPTFPYFYGMFHESSLGGILTAISIVLPRRIWQTADRVRAGEVEMVAFLDHGDVVLLGDAGESESEHFNREDRELIMLLAESKLYGG